MTAERSTTAVLVVAACLVFATGGVWYAGGTAAGAITGSGAAVADVQTTDGEITNISIDPERGTPDERMNITAQVINTTTGEPIEGVTVSFDTFYDRGELTNVTDTTNTTGYAATEYIPVAADIDEDQQLFIEGGGDRIGPFLSVTASADRFVNETADPDPVDPGNRTEVAAKLYQEQGDPFEGANVTFSLDSGTGEIVDVAQDTSDANGWVNATYEAADTDAGETVTINVTANATDANTTIPVGVTANVDAFDTVAATPPDPTAAENVTVSARMLDESGDPLDNTSVGVAANGSGTFDPDRPESNTTGFFNTTYVPAPTDNGTTVEFTLGPETDGETNVTASFANVTLTNFSDVSTPDSLAPGANATVTAVAEDEFGLPIPNATVDLDTDGEGTLNVTQVETDANGTVAASYRSADTDAGSVVQVNITANETAAETNVTIPVGANADSIRNVSVTPDRQDPGSAVTVSAEVIDEAGNRLQGANVTFNATADSGSLADPGSFAAGTATSDADGEVNTTFTPSDAAAGRELNISVVANTTGVQNSTLLNVSANPTALLTEPADPDVIDPGEVTNVSAEIRDESGDPLSGADVTFTDNGTGSLTVGQGTSNSSGWVNATYTAGDNDAGRAVAVNVTADANASVNGTVVFDVTSNPATFTNVTVGPAQPEPNESTNLSVRVRDESNTLLGDVGVELNVTSGNGSLGSVPSNSTTGGWINATYTPTGTDANTTVDIEVTANTTSANTTISFGVDPRAASEFNRTVADPAEIDPIAVGTRDNETTVGVQVFDQVGEALDGANVSFTVTAGNGTLNDSSTNSTGDGWANVTYSAVGDDAGQTVEITADAVDRAPQDTIDVSVTANPTTFTNTTVDPAQPEPNESTNLSVRLRDESGDIVGDTGVELNVTSGNGSLAGVPSNSSETGWINASYTPAGTDANTTVDIEVSANETVANTTVSFDVAERAAGEFNRTVADPAEIDPIAAPTRSNETIVGVQVLDQVGDELAGANVSFTVSAGNGTLNETSRNSTADGWANVTYSAVGDDADTTVEIDADTVDRDVSETISVAVTQNPTNFTNATVTPPQPEPNQTTDLAVRLRDESGDPLSGAGIELNVTAGNSSLTNVPSASDPGGWINASYTPTGTDANTTVRVNVSANQTVVNGTVSFDVGPRAASEFNRTAADPAEIDPITAGTRDNETTVGVRVLDQVRDPLGGANVSFTITTGNGTLNETSTNSSADGWANVTYSAVGDDANTTVEIDADAVGRDPSARISVGVTANPTNFTAERAAPEAPEPNESATVGARLLDESADPLSDEPITFTTNGSGSFTSADSATNATGDAEAVYVPASGDANSTVDIGIEAPGSENVFTNVTLDVGPLAASGFANGSLTPGTVDPITEGDRDNETTISAQVLDQFGNTLPEAGVTFSDNGAAGEFVATNTTSNATGWVNATYAAARADANSTVELSINATDRVAETNRTLDVTASPDSFAQTDADPDPVDPGNETTITAQVLDESSDPLPNADIEIVVADGNGTVTGDVTATTETTNDSGFVEVVYTPDRPDANTTLDVGLEALDTGLTTNVTVEIEALEPVTVTAEPADPATIDPVDTGSRNNETDLSAQLTDEFDQPFVGGDVTFGHNGSGTITVDQGTSNETGWVNATYAAAREDVGSTITVDVTADETGASATIPFDVTTNPDSVQDTTVSADPAPPNQSVTVGATVVDENDADYQGANVTFGIQDGNGSLSATTDTSNSNGLVETTYIPDRTDANGTVAINITANQTGANTTATFEMDRLSVDDFDRQQASPDPIDPGNSTALATRVLDEFGEPYTGNDTADPFQGGNVTFTLDSGNGTLTVDRDTNDPEGWVNATYTADPFDADTEVVVGVAANNTDAETDIRFDVDANPTNFTNTTVTPSVPEPNETATVAVRLRDESDDPLPNAGVELNVTKGNSSLAGVPSQSNGTGWVNATYTPSGPDANTTVRVNVTANETTANTTVAFEVGPRAADVFNESVADPNTIDPIARGTRNNETTVGVRVLDQVREPLGDAEVNFTVTSGAGDINGTTTNSTNSTADGWANVTYSAAPDDADETVSIQADAVGRTVSEEITFDVQPNPTNLTNATVTPPVPEPNESATVAVRVRDESGDPLPNAGVELNLTAGNSSLVGVPSESNSSGWVNASYTPTGSDANTTVRVNVTANDTAAYREIAFDVGPRAADEFNRSLADPAVIDPIARGVRTNETTVGVRVLDQVDEALGGAEVEFTVTSGAGDINGTTTNSTNSTADGWANVTYSAAPDDADQTVTILADAVGRTVSESISLTVQPNPTNLTNATVTPPVPEPNESATVAVRVRDESGDPLPNAGVELNVTEGNSTLVGVPSASNGSGWVNASYTPTGTDANTTVRINVTANDTAAYREVAFEVGPRAADEFDRSLADPAEIDPIDAPNRSNETTVAVRVFDQVDDPLADANISFTVTTGEGTLNDSSTNSSADGWANVTYTAVGDDADTTVQIDADAVGREPSATISLDVTENPTTFTNTTVSPTVPEPNQTADIAVRVRDESGDPLGGAGVELNVTTGNSSLNNVPATSDGNGWVNATYTPTGSDANTTVRVNVSANTTVVNTTVAFEVGPRAADEFNRSLADPAEIDPIAAPNRTNETTVAVRVLDQVDDPLGGANVSFAVTAGNGRLNASSTNSSADGWANVSYTAVGDDADTTVMIDADAVGREPSATISLDVTKNPTTFTNTTVSPTQPEPNETTDIAVRVRDESGDPLETAGVTLNVTAGNSSLTGVPSASNTSGWINASYTPAQSDANTTVRVNVSANTTVANTTISFDVAERAAELFRNGSTSPGEIDPVATGDRDNTTVVAAQVLDQVYEPLSGANVSFEIESGDGELTAIENVSNASGWVNATYVANRSDAGDTVEIDINATGRDAETRLTVGVTRNPDSFEGINAVAGTEPNETVEINATVLDEDGVAIDGQAIRFSANRTGTFTNGSGSFTNATVTSDGSGYVETGYEPVRADANETVAITINATATSAETVTTATLPPLAATTITELNATPAPVDPGTETLVNATVRDQFGQPLDGADVAFSDTGPGTLTPIENTSIDDGVGNATYEPAASEANTTVSVTIDAVGRSVAETVSFDVTANPTTFTNVTVSPTEPEPNETTEIAVRVRDESSDPLAAANVTLNVTAGNSSLTGVPSASDSAGWINASYTPTGPDANTTVRVNVTANETDAFREISFDVAPRAAESFTAETTADAEIDPVATGDRDNTTTVAARVLDQVGDPLGGAPVNVTVTAGTGRLTGVPAETNASGWANATYAANRTDANTTVEVTINATGRAAGTNLTVGVTSNPDAVTNVSFDPDPADAGDTVRINATVVDESDTEFDGANVTFTDNGSAAVVPIQDTSLANGTVIAEYRPDETDANETIEIGIEVNETIANTTATFAVNRLRADEFRNGSLDPDPAEPGGTVTVTAEVLDSLDQTIEGEGVDFTTNGSGSLTHIAATSRGDGTVEAAYTVAKADAGETLSFNITANATAANTTVTLDVAELAIASFDNTTTTPETIDPVAEGDRDNETVLTARVLDQVGDQLGNAPVDLTVADGNGTLIDEPTQSNTTGWVTATYAAVANDTNTTVEITVNATQTDAETNLTVNVTANPDRLTGLSLPAEIDPGENVSISPVVVDESGTPYEGETISIFRRPGTDSQFDPSEVTSNATGHITTTLNASPNDAGETAEYSLSGTIIGRRVSVDVTESADEFRNVLVDPDPVEPNETTTISAEVLNEQDQALDEADVTFTTDGNGTISPTTATSSGDGSIATTYDPVRSDADTNVTVTISANDTDAETNATVEVGALDPVAVTNGTTTAARIDPGNGTRFNATVRDQLSQPLAGQNVTFGTDGNGTLTPITDTSRGDGNVTTVYTADKTDAGETVTLNVTANQTGATTSVTVDVAELAVESFDNETATPATIDPVATGERVNETTLSARVFDQVDDPLGGAPVDLTVTAGNGTLVDEPTQSNASGWVNATYAANRTDANTTVEIGINATATDAETTLTVNVTANPDAITNVTFDPDRLDPGDTTTINATVVDEFDREFAGANVTFTDTGSGSVVALQDTSIANGTVRAEYTPVEDDANETIEIGIEANDTVANTTAVFDVYPLRADGFRNESVTPEPADPGATVTVTANVTDSLGQPIGGEPVDFSSDGNGTIEHVTTTSLNNGSVEAAYTVDKTDANETVTFEISANDTAAETSVALDVAGLEITSFDDVTATPAEIAPVATGSRTNTTAVVARVRDQVGDPLPDADVTFNREAGNGTLTVEQATSDDNGWVNATYDATRSDANTTVDISITADETAAETNQTITVTANPDAVTDVTAEPETVDPGDTVRINATVVDEFDREFEGANVTFTDTGSASVADVENTSLANGTVVAEYTPVEDDADTTVEIGIEVNQTGATNTAVFDVNPLRADGFTNETVAPEPAAPGETVTVTAEVLDSLDQTIQGEAVNFTSDGNGTIEHIDATSQNDGTVEAAYTVAKSDANETVTFDITANDTAAETNVSLDVAPLAITSFDTVTATPAEIDPVATGSRANTTAVAARVLDQVGDPLPEENVTFDLDAGTGSLTVDRNTSDAHGWVNATYAAAREDANSTVEISINATGRDAETNLTVDVTANPDAITNVTTEPDPVDPGDTVRINATVLDESDTDLAGANVTFTDNGSTSVVAVENTSLDNGTVIAEYTPVEDDANGTVEINITAPDTGVNTTAVFEVNPLRADGFRNESVTPDPADPGETVTVTADVLDSLDQPIQGEAVNFTSDGNGTVSHVAATSQSDGTVEAAYTVAKSDANSTVTFDITANETAAETNVSLDVVALEITSFDNVTARPAEIDPVAEDSPTVERDNETVLTARVLDQVGDPLGDAPVDLNVTAGNGTLLDEPTQSNTTGWVNATYAAVAADANTTAEITINATETDAETNLTVGVAANPDDITDVSLPSEVDPGENVTVSLTVVDESDTPYGGETVEFVPVGNSLTFAPENATSGSDGGVSAMLQAADADASDTVTFRVEGDIINETLSIDVTENADEFRNVTVSPEPVDPNGTATVSAEVLNERDDLIDGANVTFTSDGNGTLSPTAATSSGGGSLATSYEPARADADTNVTVTIAANDTAAETTATVEVGVLEPVALTDGTATPGRVEPNEQTTINATVRDQFGVPFAGANVSFDTTTNGTLTPLNDTSGPNGNVTATFRPTVEENATINLSVAGTAATTNVSVRVLELTPTTFGDETATPAEIAAGDRTNLSMRAFDQLGVPLPGGNISFETDGNGTLGAEYGRTDADGYVNTSYTAVVSDIRETVTVTFNATNGSANTTLAVDVVPTPQGFENVTAEPASVEPGEPVTVSATVVDERDDSLSGATVAFDANKSASFDPAENATVANGSVETTYTPLAGGNATVNLTATATDVSTSIDIGVAALAPTNVTDISLDPDPAYPNQNVTLTATVRDQLGDPFEGATVAFNATGNGTSGNGTLSALNDSSGPNGGVTTVYTAASGDRAAPVTLDLNVSNSSLNASTTLTVRSRPRDEPDDGGGGGDTDTEIIVGEIDGSSEQTGDGEVGDGSNGETGDGSETTDDDSSGAADLTDIRGSSSAIRVENPPTEEPVTLDESTTGLPSISETETTSLDGVSVSVSDRQSYWINSTSYDYETVAAAGIQVAENASGDESQPEPAEPESDGFAETEQATERITEEVEPVDTRPDSSSASSVDSGADASADESETAAFADFERQINRVPVGYLQVDTTAAPENVERVVFKYRVRKSRLDADGVTPDEIELYRKGESGWGSLETTHVRETDAYHWFESESSGLSVFPIATDRRPVEITDVSLATPEIKPGEQATVAVSIDHRGLIPNTTELTLSANGEVATTTTVTIQPNTTTTVEVPFRTDAEGAYELAVEGRTAGTLTVDSLELADVIEPVSDALGDGLDRRWLVAGIVVLLVLAAWRRF